MIRNKSNNRSFGLLFFIVFLIIGLWPLNNIYEVNIFFLFLSLSIKNSENSFKNSSI